MKLLWSRRTHFRILWRAFLVLPICMLLADVLIASSLMSSGGMGKDEWEFFALHAGVSALLLGVRLYLGRLKQVRRWFYREER